MKKTIHNLICVLSLLFTAQAALAVPIPQNVQAGTNLNRQQTDTAEEALRQTAQQMAMEYQKTQKSTSKSTKEQQEVTVTLSKIEFSSSTLLPQTFFDSLNQQYTNRPITADDIASIVDSINNEYLIKGYIAARAFLPKQNISGGVLFIRLIEGKIYSVEITGNKHTKKSYIERTINWPQFSDINMDDLQQKILNFNANNDAKARLNLAPGPVYGTTNVNVVLSEPDTFSGYVFSDNAGQDETGLYRGGASLSVRSLTGYRDILSLGGTVARGAHSASASYEIPEPWLATRVGAGFDYSDTKIVSRALETLNVTGDFYNYYVYLKKPFWIKPTVSNNFTLSFYIKNGSNYIDGATTQTTDTDLLTASFDNIYIFGGGYIFNMLSFTKGIKMLDGNKDFWRANYSGEFNKALISNLSFNLKARIQLAGGRDELPSSEKFQIGGVNTVRGYDEGLLLSEQGADAMAEVQYNLTSYMPKQITSASIYTFFDCGYISNTQSFILQSDLSKDIYSTGLGLRFSLLKYLDGNVSVARTLKTNTYLTENETKVLFFLQGKF